MRMEEMGQFSKEEEQEYVEEVRYGEYTAAVYKAKEEGKAGKNAGREPSRLGQRKPASLEKNVQEAQRQEDLWWRIEVQQELRTAKALRSRTYVPLRQELEVDPRDKELAEVLIQETAT